MNGTRSRLPGCPATPSRSQSGKTIRLVRWGLAEPAIPQNPKESSPCSGLSLEEREDEDVVLGEFRRFLSFGWSSGFYFLSFFFFFFSESLKHADLGKRHQEKELENLEMR